MEWIFHFQVGLVQFFQTRMVQFGIRVCSVLLKNLEIELADVHRTSGCPLNYETVWTVSIFRAVIRFFFQNRFTRVTHASDGFPQPVIIIKNSKPNMYFI